MIVEGTPIKFGNSYAIEIVHFSGGLRGQSTSSGWALFPTSWDTEPKALVFRNAKDHLTFATKECGLVFIGTCVHYHIDEDSPKMSVWEPCQRDPSNGLHAADSWSSISYEAKLKGDTEYSDCASHISVCLKVASLRLRDLSDKYHDQLRWSLRSNKESGSWFSNSALLDLYADCHSLVSELSSARDHLARIAAMHANAPSKIDSLARLEDWIRKPVNCAHMSQPIISLLVASLGDKSSPRWLRRLGDIRNEMIHTIPMGANDKVSGLLLEQINTSMGVIKSIRLGEPLHVTPLANQVPDPLIEIASLSTRMEHLCRAAWKHAKYPALLPVVTNRSAT